MRLKRLLSCLLTVILVCGTVLTGCSKDGSMFSDMKEIARIKTCEFTVESNITAKSSEEDLQFKCTMDGKADGKSIAANLSITWGAITYTLDDFIRMTDSTIYINMSSILSSVSSIFGGSDLISGIKSWVSIPVSETSEETQKLYLDFYDAIIDSFEKICKDQDISQSGDTWTLNISGEKLVSFIQSAMDEINANFSSWYDLYVDLLEKSGNSELLKDYALLFGEESEEEASEDAIQKLKDGKEEAMETWNDSYAEWKEQLGSLEESISNGEVNTSGTYNVSLTGKEGSQSAEQSVQFSLEDTKSAKSMSMNMNQKITEISEVTIEAPAADDVMTFDEFSELISSFMNLSSLLGGYEGYEDYEEISLPEEEVAAITSSLKENQAYLYNSDYEDMKPYVLTFDQALYTIDSNISDYSMDLWINNTESSYASVAYEQGKLSDDIVYYLEDGQKTSTMSTDIGDVSYYTTSEVDEWDCYTTTFGIQLDEESYFIGILELEKDAKLDAEACLKSLLKELKPYEGSSSSTV